MTRTEMQKRIDAELIDSIYEGLPVAAITDRVLKLLRKPTDDMVAAGAEELEGSGSEPRVKYLWSVMLGKALGRIDGHFGNAEQHELFEGT